MEITFQNKREDWEAFYAYMLNETEEGKQIRKDALRSQQTRIVLNSLLAGCFTWGMQRSFLFGLGIGVLFFVIMEFLMYTGANKNPSYYDGYRVYKAREKHVTPEQFRRFILPRTIAVHEDWLEITSPEIEHRYRWSAVNKIGLMSDFIFVHVGNCPVVYIPRRDFPSQLQFIEFGKRLIELKNQGSNSLASIESAQSEAA